MRLGLERKRSAGLRAGVLRRGWCDQGSRCPGGARRLEIDVLLLSCKGRGVTAGEMQRWRRVVRACMLLVRRSLIVKCSLAHVRPVGSGECDATPLRGWNGTSSVAVVVVKEGAQWQLRLANMNQVVTKGSEMLGPGPITSPPSGNSWPCLALEGF